MRKAFILLSSAVFAGALAAAASAQITPTELSNFNKFLDKHPEVAQKLTANPGLVNDPAFMNDHPHLKEFLANHPGVKRQLDQSPGQFMYREGHYGWAQGPAVGAGEVARFDNGYLDQHPDISRQLASNPSLVDNPQFLATHPGLDQYLAAHPDVRQELQTHPERFMNDEKAQELREHGPGISAGAISGFDENYLDHHPEVAKQLASNPRMVDNPNFLATHPGLDQYLAAHPEVRTQLLAHPERFMSDEKARELREGGAGISSGAVSGFDNQYLDHHRDVSEQLGSNPRLIDDPNYLATHPGLDQYLAAHPEVRSELQSHPERFMHREARYEDHEDDGNHQHKHKNGDADDQTNHPDH